MASLFRKFDARYAEVLPVAERDSELEWEEHVLDLEDGVAAAMASAERGPLLDQLWPIAKLLRDARYDHKPVIVFFGGHVIKCGLSRYLIDLISTVTHYATNGAGLLHDFELATNGATSESVAQYLPDGKFGMWRCPTSLNPMAKFSLEAGQGYGEFVGVWLNGFPHPATEVSVFRAAVAGLTPITVHSLIGGDINHMHPDFDPAALGQASYNDFLIFVESVAQLEGGVFLNIGSSVHGPELFLKALSLARNVSRGQYPQKFTTVVFDLAPLPRDWRTRADDRDDADYYFRPWKTILRRAVSEGGMSYYVQGDHRLTLPLLWHLLNQHERKL